MLELIVGNEGLFRLGVFATIFIVVSIWEVAKPRRKLNYSKKTRWLNNIAITTLNIAVMRFLFPILAIEMAIIAGNLELGLFNMVNLPLAVQVILSVVLLDLVVYLQHRKFHTNKYLSRIHKTHHTDLDYDITTALRFHPIEIAISMLVKVIAVLVLGVSPIAVVIFEMILNMTAMFNHGNIHISPKVDKIMRNFIVTPDMHRIHHSPRPEELNSNYGFNVPWWDRLFGTYVAEPKESQIEMKIGMRSFRKAEHLRIKCLLAQPFLKDRKYRDRSAF